MHSAYRAELAGLTGLSFFFSSIRLPPPTSLHQEITCDCKSGLQKLPTSPEFVKGSTKHQDLVSLISHLWTACPHTPIPSHVFAHQDKYLTFPLTPKVELNCRMDSLAKDFVLNAITTGNITPPHFNTHLGFGTIICHEAIISNSIQSSLYHTVTHFKFTIHLSNLFETDVEDLRTLVSWDCLQMSRTSTSFGIMKFISKFVGGDIATGHVMKR